MGLLGGTLQSSLLGLLTVREEGSLLDNLLWLGAYSMGDSRPGIDLLCADLPGTDHRCIDPPGTDPLVADPYGADHPGIDPPDADQLGSDPHGADPPDADPPDWPPRCFESTFPCGDLAATDCGCWKITESVSEAVAPSLFSSSFPWSSPRCLVPHFPSCRTSAPGSYVTFDPVLRTLSSGQWPAERPAFACSCARLRVRAPPSRGTGSVSRHVQDGSSFPGFGIFVHPATQGGCHCPVVASCLVAHPCPGLSASQGQKASEPRSC